MTAKGYAGATHSFLEAVSISPLADRALGGSVRLAVGRIEALSDGCFNQWSNRDIADLVASYPLAWVVTGAPEFAATMLPMLLETDADGRPVSLLGHFAKSNAQVESIRAESRARCSCSPGRTATSRLSWSRPPAIGGRPGTMRRRGSSPMSRSTKTLNDEALEKLVDKMEQGRRRSVDEGSELGRATIE